MKHAQTSVSEAASSAPPPPSAAASKWGDAAYAGFQLLPDVLLKNQRLLGLSPTELVVLINVTMHWWYPEIKPFPRATTIAERIGIDIRTVQRALKRMEDELGLIRRVKRDASEGFSTVIELDGLVSRLNDFAKNDLSYNYRKREGLLPTLNAV